MKGNSQLVSIIIPAYNAEKYIEETIQSVIDQTYTNWELIIVVDGATDRTGEIVKKIAKTDDRIQYILKDNSGVSDTRNKGLEKASGEFIGFLDADDTWNNNNLEEKINLLNSEPEVMWVFSDMYLCDAEMANPTLAPLGSDQNVLNSILLWEGEVVPGPCSNVLVRRSYLGEEIRFDEKFSTAADQDFTIQLAAKGGKGKRIPEPLWNYRVLSQSMSRNISVMEKDHIGVFLKAGANKLYESNRFRRKCFSNLYMILAGSWWTNGNNKFKAILFMVRSILLYPKNVNKLIKKLV